MKISGVYPHLCTYTFEPGEPHELSECGIGAVVPWAGRLWMITYGAHLPDGSSHKLYSIDEQLTMTIHSESVGGTPAGRMIHAETNQLLIGHYLINAAGEVRVIPPATMPGRVTAIARHLTDPANRVYYVDMEGMIYEVDVRSLAVTKRFHKPVPGWHGKGGYTSQGRLVVSNNGEHAAYPLEPGVLQVEDAPEHPENAGVLAEWDGTDWRIVERRQYCEVTGPGGIHGAPDDKAPLWSIGWDRRSLRLKLLDGGRWYTFLLPKAAHNNDPRHGWFTEWPRIRAIGGGRMMMDMHGMFYAFPASFSVGHTAGIAPIGSHLRYIPDFCTWNGRLVIATDEASVMGHALCGQPQSNLWFGEVEDLKRWGPASAYGGPWIEDAVRADTPSDPFLIAGFARRLLHLAADRRAAIRIEIDPEGTGEWILFTTVTVDGYTPVTIPAATAAEWMRLVCDRDCRVTAYFHGTDAALRKPDHALFAGLADLGEAAVGGLLYPARANRDLKIIPAEGELCFDVSCSFDFNCVERDRELAGLLAVTPTFEVDLASVIVTAGACRYRLPKGSAGFDAPFACGRPRAVRELESERNLANLHGTFYEVPRSGYKATPDWERMRPVASHSKQIHDYCTWQGLLVLSGVRQAADADAHTRRGRAGGAIWCGAIDDLWQLGKPVGTGGPWQESAVRAGEPSDAYLMTGYDRKTLRLSADRDVTLTIEVNIDHQSGWHTYRTVGMAPGDVLVHEFPDAYSAHWIRFTADRDCTATAWLVYE